MVKITFLHCLDYFSGVFTSIYDSYLNIREDPLLQNRVECKIFNAFPAAGLVNYVSDLPTNVFPKFFRLPDSTIQNPQTLDYDIVVTSANFFRQKILHVHNINFNCKNLIILDSTCYAYLPFESRDYALTLKKSMRTTRKSTKITLLCNPYTGSLCQKYLDMDYLEYYHKLSPIRINALRHKKRKPEIFDTEKYRLKYYRKEGVPLFVNPHSYESFSYERYFELNPGVFYENIGKLIWEYKLLGKKVSYSPRNKSLDDGLHYYFKRLNLDDTQEYDDIPVSEDLLKEKMYMGSDDLLKTLLKKGIEEFYD